MFKRYIMYTKIDRLDYYKGNKCSFDDSDIRILLENSYKFNIGYGCEVNLADSFISIFKLSDEWFLVKSLSIGPLIEGRRQPRKAIYYRCDQIDGLLQCLKDING